MNRQMNLSELKAYAESMCKDNGHRMVWSKGSQVAVCEKCDRWLEYDKTDVMGDALEEGCK